MSIGSILVGILLLAALGAAVAQPWWRPTSRRVAKAAIDPREEYEALVATIRDLDFDHQAGVLTEADYRPLRDDLAARAVSRLQNLDRATDETGFEEQIEALRPFDGAQGRLRSGQAAVSALRATRQDVADAHPDGNRPTVCHTCGQAVRADIRFCARCGAKLELSCPNCHGPVEVEDRFCATCGQMLVKEVVAV